jgi:hypothetical protein
MPDDLKRARSRVKKKKVFFVHLGVFLSVGLFFFLINLLTYDGEFWFFFPMLPWGVGLAIHYISVFGLPGTDILTQEWEKRELEKEMFNMRRKREMLGEGSDEDPLDLNDTPPERAPRYPDPDEEEFV